jgi:hypothetical protein
MPEISAPTLLLQPDLFVEDDCISTYPFFIHDLTGGVPLKPPRATRGNIADRAVLRGSIKSQPSLDTLRVRAAGRAKT